MTVVLGASLEDEPADEGAAPRSEKKTAGLSVFGGSVVLLESANVALCGVPLGLQ